jgi:hypothetical protein
MQTQGGEKIGIEVRGDQAAVKFLSGPDAGKFAKDTLVDIQKTPALGLMPVEIWKNGTRVHFGNKIVDVGAAKSSNSANAAAVRAYRSALVKAADTQIVTKGVSDVPLFMNSNVGRVFMQFQSFAFASHQRVLISGLQGRPRHMGELFVASTAAGMMVSYLKLIEQGKYDEADQLLRNPGRAVAEGIDRSGLFAVPFTASNMYEKIGGYGLMKAMQDIAGDEDKGGPISRYANRNVAGTLGGPAAGLLQDIATFSQQFLTGDIKESGINSAFRLVPGRSLPGVRSLVEMELKPRLKDELVE